LLLARVRSLARLRRSLDGWTLRRETARALGLAGDPTPSLSVAGTRVPMIDDWGPDARTVQDALASDGLVTDLAGSGTEGVHLARAAHPTSAC